MYSNCNIWLMMILILQQSIDSIKKGIGLDLKIEMNCYCVTDFSSDQPQRRSRYRSSVEPKLALLKGLTRRNRLCRNFRRRRRWLRFPVTAEVTPASARIDTYVQRYMRRRSIPRPTARRWLKLDTRRLMYVPLRLPPVPVSRTASSNCRLKFKRTRKSYNLRSLVNLWIWRFK